MKKLILIILALLCVFGVSCDNGADGNTPEPKQLTLFNTKWKLMGFVNAETNELTEPTAIEDCNDCYTIEFDSIYLHSHYYLYVVYPSDETLKPNSNEKGMSNNDALNKIFKDFKVVNYYQSFPGAQNIELENTYEIHFKGNVDSLENALKAGNYFEKIYRADYYTIPEADPDECCNADGRIIGNGLNFSFDGYCLVDYALSTIKLAIQSIAVISKNNPEYSSEDEKYISEGLTSTHSFELKDTELKLFYNENKDYLLFRRVQ